MKQAEGSRSVSKTDVLRFRMRPVALALACMGAAPAFAQLPSWNSFVVRGGAVSVGVGPGNLPMTANGTASAAGTILPINQTSQRAIIDWQGFSIGQGNAVNITQPAANSVLLNRVTGNELSTIAGSMTANGRVFLVNPNGVLFTGTSSVNVGGLVASTLGMTTPDADFMNGTEHFEFTQGNGIATLTAQGTITTQGKGGTVALVSAGVDHSGSINAPGGTAALVSADKVTLDPFGDGLTTFKLTAGVASGVTNSGLLRADGGRVALLATGGNKISDGVLNVRGVLRADSVASRGGEIVLDSGSSDSGVVINGGVISASDNGAGLKGGSVDITGRTILLQPYVPPAVFAAAFQPPTTAPDPRGIIDASGGAGGGTVSLHAVAVGGAPQTGAIAVAAGSTIGADATGNGNGGEVRLLGERTLRAFGNLSARGGPAGGNGGIVETSGGYAVPAGDNNGGIALAGLRVDASAPAGTAGTWLVDPYDVTIANGAAAGTLPPGVFDPIVTSTIQDGDINAALDAGTSVHITTGSSGPVNAGTVTFGVFNQPPVLIERKNGGAPVTFQVDANLGINAFDNNTVIRSTGGAVNVVFNAGLSTAAFANGAINYNGQILTNGGDVTMVGNTNTTTSQSGINLNNALIDTRVGQSDAAAGGKVQVLADRGPNVGFSVAVVSLQGTRVLSSTGDVTLSGLGNNVGSGVYIGTNGQGVGGVYTTSGDIRITGVGSGSSGSGNVNPGHGVEINAATVQSVDGDITVQGLRIPRTIDVGGNGVRIDNGAVVTTLGKGNIELTGEAQIADAGVYIQPFVPAGFAAAVPASRVDGNNNVVLRAASAGGADALVIGGTVRAGNVLNLRPGGVDAIGNASDRIADPITLGGTAASGFAVSADEFTRIAAGSIVAGSNLHAGNIDVVGPLSMASPLTLQNGGGGNITLGAPVATAQLGLFSGGNITQAAGASIAATTLVARSSGGNVTLTDQANNVGLVGGGAAGRFEYTDANAVTLGAAAVGGFDAGANLPQVVAAAPVAADRVVVRTLTGDLSLGTDVASTSGADLVAAARFQNLGAYGIAGAPWRVWADTWVGETRGGLFGSGALPNLYHCAYLGPCGVTVSGGDNHFIYAQQPTATVVIGDTTRRGGLPNPPFFVYSITGLILGDSPAGFPGQTGTAATIGSPPGVYAINGAFSSAAGYAVNVVPGRLRVTDFVQLPKVDVLRDLPTTWLYDRNIGPAPICLATGPLDGDRAQQGGDILAREWSRVRSRPNLTSCVDTERRNGCADF